MAESETQAPAKPKRSLSPEQLAKMAAGREASRARRKLVPDPSAVTEQNGQTLTRVRRAPESIDDVARRHIDEELPPIDQLADRAELYTENDAVPPPEPNPVLRDLPSMGAIQFTEDEAREVPDLSDNQPRTLLDLYSIFPVGDGEHFIYVTRSWPKSVQGIPCYGVQRRIQEQITLEEFQDIYGGGAYELIVYGPPRHGANFGPDGKLEVKALTKPIKMFMPGAPQTDSMLEDDAMNAEQSGRGRGYRGPASQGDARLREVELGHQERQSVREESRFETERRRLEQQRQEEQRRDRDMTQILADQKEKEISRIQQHAREQIERVEKAANDRIELLTQQSSGRGDATVEAIKVLEPILNKGNGVGEAQMRELTLQLKALEDRYRELQGNTERLVRAADDRADTRVRQAEDRAEARVRDENDRCTRRIQEVEQRSKETEALARTSAQTAIDDARRRCDERIQDEVRNHERDQKSLSSTFEARLESQKANYEMQLSNLKSELDRTRTELERTRTDLDNSKDIGKQVEKFARQAEQLGFTKEGALPPEAPDWKTMLAQAGFGMLDKLPEIFRSAAEVVRPRPALSPEQIDQIRAEERLRMMQSSQVSAAQIAPAARVRALSSRRPSFATEDGPDFDRGAGPQYVAPRQSQYEPAAPIGPQPGSFQEARQIVEQPPPVISAPAAPPPMSVAPPPPMAAPSAGEPAAAAIDPQVVQLAQFMRQPLEVAQASGSDPAEVARAVISQFGAPMALQVAELVSVEMLVEAIQQQPNGGASSLVRRDGQKFLREIMAAVKNLAVS